MKRLLALILATLVPVASAGAAYDWREDPIESMVGIHIVPNFGDDPTIFSSDISARAVHSALQSVDWINDFNQVVLVISPGVSMEVGGSLNPEHGLSAVYRNRLEGVEAVTKEAPESIADLEAILQAFLKRDDSWRQVQEFTF